MPQPTTVISERAAGRIVQQALASVPGCIHHASGLDRVTGRELPRWEVDLDPENRAMSIEVQIAVRWPSPVTQVATTVREVLHGWLEAYTDIPVISVDVAVAAVVPASLSQDTPERITADQLAATPRTPATHGITAQPLRPRPVRVDRVIEEPLHPKPLSSVELTPIVVNEFRGTTDIPEPTAITPFAAIFVPELQVRSVEPPRETYETTAIEVDHTEARMPLTPEPILPTKTPVTNRRPVISISTDIPERHTTPIRVDNKGVQPLLTPRPILPTRTPLARPLQVTHLVGEIAPRLDPIYVESVPLESVTAYPLRPKPVTVHPTEVKHPKAPEKPVDRDKVMAELDEDEAAAVRRAEAGWPGAFAPSKKTIKRRQQEQARAKRKERQAKKVRTVVSPGTSSTPSAEMAKDKSKVSGNDVMIPALKERR